jgi:hypothetical protein
VNISFARVSVAGTGNCSLVTGLLASAAAKNPGIENMIVSSVGDSSVSFEISSHIKAIELIGAFNYSSITWPENTTIQSLTLSGIHSDLSGYTGGYEGLFGDLWALLEQKSVTVKHLVLYCWSPSLPLYLLSPKSCVERLDLDGIPFDDDGHRMDSLILGLVGSHSVAALYFKNCYFDSEQSLERLYQVLRAGLTEVKHLSFWGWTGESFPLDKHYNKLLECPLLESLGFRDHSTTVDHHMETVKAGLESSFFRLSSLHPMNLLE